MTPRATRVLTLAVAGALMLGAAAAWACERSAKSASAASCSARGATMSAKACAAHGCTAAKRATATAARPTPAPAPKKATPATAGMRVYRDPETGLIGGAPAVKTIGADGLPMVDDMPTDLPQTPLAHGGYTVDLQGYGQEYATLQIDAKGHKVFTCTSHPRAQLKKTVAAEPTLDHPEK